MSITPATIPELIFSMMVLVLAMACVIFALIETAEWLLGMLV